MTGPNAVAALANQPVELYSDLLLHDMGDALADDRPDGSATGREWRTTPLWGLRLMRQFLDGQALLLHDGRARTLTEAILRMVEEDGLGLVGISKALSVKLFKRGAHFFDSAKVNDDRRVAPVEPFDLTGVM